MEPYSARECRERRMQALREYLISRMTLAIFSKTYEVDNEHREASASAAEPHSRASTRTRTLFRIIRGCPQHPLGALCPNLNIPGITCNCSACNCSITLDGDRSTCAVCLGDFAESRREPVRILRCEHAFHVSPFSSALPVSACSH